MIFRRQAVALVLAVTLSTSAVIAPKRAEAGFSLLLAAWGGQPLILYLGIIGSSGSAGGAVLFARKAWRAHGPKAFLYSLLALGCTLAFVYVLDGPSSQPESFPSLSRDQARALGLTEAEHVSYESERMQIQSLAEEAMLRASSVLPLGRVETLDQMETLVLALHQEWNGLAPALLSADSVRAIQKMSTELTSKLGK